MMTLTLTSMRPVLDQFRGSGLLVTCYANTFLTPGSAPAWPAAFKVKMQAVDEMLADDLQAQQQFRSNLEAIGRALEAPEARRHRGMAVFSAVQRSFFQAVPVDLPVENELVVHQAPYVVPLLEIVCRQREYLVVQSNTHHGRIFAAAAGELRLLHEIEENVPKRQHSSGERWGKQQATIARHREDCIRHFQKELIDRVAATWAEHPYRGIMLVGDHVAVEHVRKQLPSRLARRVVSELAQPWSDRPLAIAGAVEQALTEAAQANETRLLADLEERLLQGYGVAAGSTAVIEALQSGRIGPRGHGYLVLGPDLREAVARCTGCRALSTELVATCPRCQASCVEASLWEELLLFALRHDITAHSVKQCPSLTACGGLAAVLPN